MNAQNEQEKKVADTNPRGLSPADLQHATESVGKIAEAIVALNQLFTTINSGDNKIVEMITLGIVVLYLAYMVFGK
jgi:uncharacterized membrane protein YkvA (DUF1232 family)